MQCLSPPNNAPLSVQATARRFSPDLGTLHPNLLRFARTRLRNIALAEDAVSETVLAVLQAQPTFSTPAQATAWVYGILRHKLVDQLRQQGRETPAGDGLPEPDTRSAEWFVGGAWCGLPATRAEPDEACSLNQFVALVLRCCEELPPLQRQAFLLRELGDEDPADICRQLAVTEGHLWVLMYRARLRLREMLCARWPLSRGAALAGKTQRRGGRAAGTKGRGGQTALERGPSATAPCRADVTALPTPIGRLVAQESPG